MHYEDVSPQKGIAWADLGGGGGGGGGGRGGRQTVVQPEVLHWLECPLGHSAICLDVIKVGAVLIEWAWPKIF